MMAEIDAPLFIQTSDSKIKFKLGKIELISKVIDGKFPTIKKLYPKTTIKH